MTRAQAKFPLGLTVTNVYRVLATRLFVDSPSPALKQLPTAFAFLVAILLSAASPDVLVSDGLLVGASVVSMAVALVLCAYCTRLPRETRWVLLVPGISFLALELLRAGTGGAGSAFVSLTILPVIWIAAEKGRQWIVVAALGTSAGLMLPYLLGRRLPADASEWVRVIVTPMVFALTAAVINEISRQGRKKVQAIRRLAEERAAMLDEVSSTALQLHENEARLRTADQLTRSVLDAVTEQSVIGTDLTGLIDVWNPGAAAMLGLASDEAQRRRYVFEFHLPDELENRSRELNYPPGATVLNPGFSALVESARLGTAEVRQWTYVRDDGSQVAVRVAVTPRVDEEGETVGYIFVATDVTQDLEVARLKDEFVGLISHELRTPLSSILGYIELMRDDEESPLSKVQLQYLGVAERNAHRLLRLVGDLLFTAQVESGRFPLNIGDVDLSTVVSGAIESAGPIAAGAGVELVGELPNVSPVVRGEATRLGQACDNLISNAIKFTPRGGSVTVTLISTGDDAVVGVRDTGMGIPASELDQLTSRFFRASTATRNAVPGVGLGLTITKAIVTAHEGELAVESEEGVGTEFSMSLPLAQSRA